MLGGGRNRTTVGLAVVVLVVVVLSACKPLREYPAAKAMVFGTAARASLINTDATYTTTLAKEFGALVPENELKWDTIHPQPNVYNFAPADTLVNFARDHAMTVRGVPLLWNSQNPAWLTGGQFSRSTLRATLENHIRTVVGRYKGRIAQWDVVNEPFLDTGALAPTLWRTRLGSSYMDNAFAVAHAADPAAKLFLNDYGIEKAGPKADAAFAAISSMKARGVPINGVGFEMHSTLTSPTAAQLAVQIARYATIGVEVAITEMDVRLQLPVTPQALQGQARVYRDALATCRAAPNCKTFVMWGFTDKYSWIPGWSPGFGSGLIMDELFKHKAAYDELGKYLDGQ